VGSEHKGEDLTIEAQQDRSAPGRAYALGGDLPVGRVGFGALRITGQPGNWGYPEDRDGAVRLLRRVVDLGITFIDTADSYGPEVSENLIAEALWPYRDDVVIGTKVGAIKLGPGMMRKNGRPDHLRQAAERCLQRLRLDSLPLLQYHWVDPEVPLEESVGALQELRTEGKVRHVGLCNVTADQLHRALAVGPIASVQNPYSLADRSSDLLVGETNELGIAFIPYTPLVGGALAQGGGPLDALAEKHSATASQIALAWLLARSPNILLIPGTSSIAHLEENTAVFNVVLDGDDVAGIDALISGN
jgi:pyridoxine 4-dehydrogenase